MNRKIHFITILILLISGCSTPLERGNNYYQQGLYDNAAYQWNPPAEAGNPYAQYNLGLLWEQGLGSTSKDLNQAAEWYLRSAQQGFPPAMVRLANIQLSLGNEIPAVSWLNLAARWGNQDATSILRNKSRPVPSPDLLQQSIAARERQNQENIDALMGLILIGAMIEGANNGNVVNSGYFPPTNSTYSSSTGNYPSNQTRSSNSVSGITMCPDGTFVSGRENCTLTPDGSFVGGGRGTTTCPDGSFVAGSRCNMAPDGSFVGVD